MNPLELAVYSITAVIGLMLLTVNSLRREPEWLLKDLPLKENWKRLGWYSLIVGVLFGLGAFFINLSAGWNQQSIVFASLGGFMFFQSIFTDFRLRRVDRWGQRIVNVLAFGTGAYVLLLYGGEIDWIIYLGFIGATFAIGLLSGAGPADGRAFQFLVLVSYPVASMVGLQWAAVGFLIALILYYVGISLMQGKFTVKGLFTKVSFPLVPVIMAPALVVTLFGRGLPGF